MRIKFRSVSLKEGGFLEGVIIDCTFILMPVPMAARSKA